MNPNDFEFNGVYSTQVFDFKILEKISNDAIITNYGFLRILTDFMTVPTAIPFKSEKSFIFTYEYADFGTK